MTKFIQALFDLKLVSQDSFNQMKTMKGGEGMGMEPFMFAGRTLYGHTGGSGSSGAWLAYYPEERLAFSYTTNAKIYPVSNIVNGVSKFTGIGRFRSPPSTRSTSDRKFWTATSECIRIRRPPQN
jgi:CubicO group peptidase (beta-lactamase class C family)